MAAEFLLTFAAEGILTKVSSLASEELTLAWGLKAELKKLGNSLSIIQDFLHGAADQKPQDHQGKAVEEWVKKLKDIAHEADDVLDDFNYEVLRRKVELQNHMKRKVLNFLSASNPLLFRLKMAHKIKKINDSLVELKKEASFINLVAKRRDSSPGGERPDRQTDSSFEKDEKVVGREDVVSKIVESLTNSNKQQDLSVMAIVGMPGLGKTTLAKSVYNEPAIDTHFHKKIWVCVSNTFDVDVILSHMLESLTRHNTGMKNRSPLIDSLKDELTGKKYVLILDDVWSEDESKWEILKSCLSKLNSSPGTSIIITTRSAGVASIAETALSSLPRLELPILSTGECWSILKQGALNMNDVIDADQERIGWAIAEKCGGIPLVAKVLGGIMRSKTSRDDWLSIQESEIWKLPKAEDKIMSVLKLSFDNLKPPPLKQCFAYCSLLRKDFEIERDNLIQLWMAQGLLQSSTEKNHHEMEDTGNEYFNILLNNSLFQEVTEDGTITKYTMHDLVHDLAEKVSKGESLTRDSNDTCGVRHVARIPTSTLENMSEVTVRRLHSLFSNDQVPDIIFSKFRALRVLNLQRAKIRKLSNSFGKLKHLRYLDVSYSRIKALPKSIGKLYNLQTLRMQQTDCLNEVPREMQNLISLKHLYFDEDMEFPAGIFRGLTNLRTLSYFNVGKEMGLGIEELGGLNDLKGELIIRNLQNIKDEEEAKKAKLEDKKNVLELSYVWSESRSNPEGLESRPSSNINDENVLEGLKPHTKLESLRIENFMGDKFPSWMMRNPLPLNNLKKVLLFGCLGCEGLPILGHLPGLGHVEISGMHNLKHLGSEFYGYNHVDEAAVAAREKEIIVLFPALKTLSIVGCGELTEWMEAPTTMTSAIRKVVVFPCLEKLTLLGCPLLRDAPSHFPSLKELLISGMGSEKPMASICNEVSTLTSLHIRNIKGLTSLSSEMLKKNKNLTSLEIKHCDEIIRIAPNVRELSIQYCKKPEQLDTLPLLEKLTISQCPAPEFIPIDHDMASLRELEIEDCDGLSRIGLLDHCTSLQELKIRRCRNLTSIPISQGLASLRELEIEDCDGLSRIGLLDHCTSLQELKLRRCRNLTSIPISQGLASLRNLEIEDCDGLSSIGILDHCTSLQELKIRRCRNLTSIPISQGLASLRNLEIEDCDGLSSIGILDHCTSLQELKISRCGNLTSIPISQGLASLRNLEIWECDGLSSIGILDHCTSLQELEISRCGNLTSIPISQGLASLRKLDIWECDGLSSIDIFDHCTSLQELEISGCGNLTSIPISQGLASLRKLAIYRCGGLTGLPCGIENCTISFTRVLPSLLKLQVYSCDELSCLLVLEYCPSLQVLSVSECPKLASISFSADLNPCLKELYIEDCNGLQPLPDFRSFTSLLVLEIEECTSLVCGFHIPVSLEELRISQCHNLESIPCLDECTSLRQLQVWDCEKLKSLSTGLRCLTRLENLDLGPFWEELDSFPDFQAPSQQLDGLELSGWPKLKSLPQQVQHFTSLTKLTIRSFNGVEALPEWLGNLASLQHLTIVDCENLKSLPSLKAMQRLTKLEDLRIRRCPVLKKICTKDSGEEWPKISDIPSVIWGG